MRLTDAVRKTIADVSSASPQSKFALTVGTPVCTHVLVLPLVSYSVSTNFSFLVDDAQYQLKEERILWKAKKK